MLFFIMVWVISFIVSIILKIKVREFFLNKYSVIGIFVGSECFVILVYNIFKG